MKCLYCKVFSDKEVALQRERTIFEETIGDETKVLVAYSCPECKSVYEWLEK